MLTYMLGVLLCIALSTASPVDSRSPSQHVLDLSNTRSQEGNPRKLHGRFLHITDIHPDPFYKQGTDSDGENACHRGHGTAGYFGAEKTECDTPFSLVNATFDWIKHNIRDQIDFVVWTGDSARHDNDDTHYPRTNKQVEYLNNFIVSKFDEVFGKPDNRNDPDPTNDFVVPIVPTYGNNDILPHNIFEPGPNKWTRKYLTIWEKFVPQEQRHSFARGGWFFTEVIPNRLAVFSLNTLYFFDSNGAVDGCDADTEPGYEHFEWLRIQLQFLRERKMKAILMGHVPPARTESKQNWDETCYQKYVLWLRQYRDVIIGNIFGHMNLDHFILQDVRQLTYKFKIKGIDDERLRDDSLSINDDLRVEAKPDYLNELRQLWGNLPKPPRGISYTSADFDTEKSKKKSKKKKKKEIQKFFKEIGGPYGERFSLSIISPSVVPNFYPTLRVIEYNITGLKHDHPALYSTAPKDSDLSQTKSLDDTNLWSSTDDWQDSFGRDDSLEAATKKKHKKKKGKKSKPNFPIPDPPSKSSPPGPGYSSQSLSFISWTQLYANLTKINEDVAKEAESLRDTEDHRTTRSDSYEVFKKHFNFEVEYSTKEDKVYSMDDLTVPSWLDYAEKIGRAKIKKADVNTSLALGRSEQFSKQYESGDEIARVDAEVEAVDEIEENEGQKIDPDCLEYYRKLKAAELAWYNPWHYDPWPSKSLLRLRGDLLSSNCRPGDELDLHPDDNEEDEEGDSGYDSDRNLEDDTDDQDDENTDSGYDDDYENEDDDSDSNEAETSSRKKKKHKGKKKKSRKRKGMSLKNNHLWHAFVRRAFVDTKSFEELKDEFG